LVKNVSKTARKNSGRPRSWLSRSRLFIGRNARVHSTETQRPSPLVRERRHGNGAAGCRCDGAMPRCAEPNQKSSIRGFFFPIHCALRAFFPLTTRRWAFTSPKRNLTADPTCRFQQRPPWPDGRGKLESELANLNAVYGHAESPEPSLSGNLHRFLLLRDFSRSNHGLQFTASNCLAFALSRTETPATAEHQAASTSTVATNLALAICGQWPRPFEGRRADANISRMFTRLILLPTSSSPSSSHQRDQSELHTSYTQLSFAHPRKGELPSPFS
jgi:hypothetical protein